MLSIETTTKLLKLHLKWPDRRDHEGRDSEPKEFFKWLFINHHDKPEFAEISSEAMVEEFLVKNRHVLWPSSTDEEKFANLRLEPRIECDAQAEITVVKSDDLSVIGSSTFGHTLDIGLHGMRLTINDAIPTGVFIKTRILSVSGTNRTYQLDAEVRWDTSLEDGHLIGVQLVEDGDYSDWRGNFGTDFVAPAMKEKKGAA